MTQPEPFDDELLSAYLDDELAPEERARVEAHLAANAAARQLLEELRSVSSAVKRLPQESLPADMRETVLRRAERAMLTNSASPSGEPASAGGASGLIEVLRKIPIGRSRRAWVWAGTALAAGLLLMIFDKRPDQDAELPREVARHDVAAVRKPLPPLEMRSVEESRSEPATVALSRDQSSPVAAAPAGATIDGFRGGEGGVSLGAVARSRSAETPVAPRDDVDLLVVHVNARPDAIEQKLIDGVLARNGIDVEAGSDGRAARTFAAVEPQAGFSSSAASAPASGERMLREEISRTKGESQEQPVDVVLVEAEPSQIYACLSELDADRTNYFGIAIDDQMSATNRSSAISAYNWKQLDRGIVPAEQKVQVSADKNLYLETAGRQIAIDIPPGESVDKGSSVRSGERFQWSRSAQSQSESDVVTEFGYARRGMQKLAAKADTLQVLFVLTSPTEHAAPAAAPAATSPSPADSVP